MIWLAEEMNKNEQEHGPYVLRSFFFWFNIESISRF